MAACRFLGVCVAYWLLLDVRCKLFVLRCLLLVVTCSLDDCCYLYVASCLLPVVCGLWFALIVVLCLLLDT